MGIIVQEIFCIKIFRAKGSFKVSPEPKALVSIALDPGS